MRGGGLVVVSPHLDDAVLGCSALLATHPGAVVTTVFAGRPPAGAPLPPWDEAAGFRVGDDVVGARRAEDRAALATFDAQPLWLNFLDAQYGHPPPPGEVDAALESALVSAHAGTVCIPLGLFHSDHALAHVAAVTLLSRRPEWRWLAYEEPIYRRVPGALADRLASLHAGGVATEALDSVSPPDSKRHAMSCYASQLRALGTPGRPGYIDALARERYWALTA